MLQKLTDKTSSSSSSSMNTTINTTFYTNISSSTGNITTNNNNEMQMYHFYAFNCSNCTIHHIEMPMITEMSDCLNNLDCLREIHNYSLCFDHECMHN
uniref:Uncharacterized protein n=1 Tax=Trichobilharzia regenti TaxID=157069 RepID=A0AA85KKM8_TRIRE|nr:unnamed protein product [Trichobilharzia regenti]